MGKKLKNSFKYKAPQQMDHSKKSGQELGRRDKTPARPSSKVKGKKQKVQYACLCIIRVKVESNPKYQIEGQPPISIHTANSW